MARGVISDYAFWRNENNAVFVGASPSVTVYEAGTITLVDGGTLWNAPTGGSSVGNPVSGNADGSFSFWADNPRLFKLSVNIPGIGVVVRDNVPCIADISQLVTLDGIQTVSNKTLEDWHDKGGIFFDVGAFPQGGEDPYDWNGPVDATPALRAAGAACEAAGGGWVIITKTIRIMTRLIWDFRNVKLLGVGHSMVSFNPKVGIINDVQYLPAIVFRDREEYDSDIGDQALYEGTGGETGMRDIAMFQNAALAIDPSGYEGGSDIRAAVLLYKCSPALSDDDPLTYVYNGRVRFENVAFSAGFSNVQIGIGSIKGAAEVIFDRCKFGHQYDAIRVMGLDYLFVDQCIAGQTVRQSGFAFIRLDGSSTNQPDGFYIRNCFTEDYWGAIMIRHSAGSIGNCEVFGCVFDGCHLGIWINAAGTVNGVRFWGCLITGWATGNGTGGEYQGGADSNPATHEEGDHVVHPGTSWGALIDCGGAGAIGGVSFYRCRISNFTNQGILVTPATSTTQMTTLDVEDCVFNNNNQQIGGSVISICEASTDSGTSRGIKQFSIRRNKVYSTGIFTDAHGSGIVPAYAVTIGLGCDNFIVDGNIAQDTNVQTSVIQALTVGNLNTKVYKDNIGKKTSAQAPFTMNWNIGGFHRAGLAASQTDLALYRATSNGTVADSVDFWVAPYDCIIHSLTAGANAAIAGSAIVFELSINGTPSATLQATMAVGQQTAIANSATGIAVSRGQRVGVVVTSDASLTGTPDIGADMQAVAMS